MTPTEDLGKYVAKNSKDGRIIACFHSPNEKNWTYLVVFLDRKQYDNELKESEFKEWLDKYPKAIAYEPEMVERYFGNKYAWYYHNELQFLEYDPTTVPLEKILNNLEKEVCNQKNI